jgi:hypothetical protein
MYRRLWGDIVEGENLVIFIDDLRGYFSVDDLGEQSIQSCFSMVNVQGECTQPVSAGNRPY